MLSDKFNRTNAKLCEYVLSEGNKPASNASQELRKETLETRNKGNTKQKSSPVRNSGPHQQEVEEEQQLLSADGRTLLNLWFIPHFSQVLHMFQTLSVPVK